MKKLLVAIALIVLIKTGKTQCFDSKSFSKNETTIAFGALVDWSLKYYQPSGFSGIGVHAGVWIDHIGVFGGFAESKLNSNTIATRELALTLATRYSFLKDRLVTSAFFAHGFHNYQDIGIRAGYDIWDNGIAVGAMTSRMMHFGISVMITSKH
jgi:hypothetical protein